MATLKENAALKKSLEDLKTQVEGWKDKRKEQIIKEVAFLKSIDTSIETSVSSPLSESTAAVVATVESFLSYKVEG